MAVLLVSISATLIGCGTQAADEPKDKEAIISELKARLAAKNTFKDPATVQYQNVQFFQNAAVLKDGRKVLLQATICGEVNRDLNGDSAKPGRFVSRIVTSTRDGLNAQNVKDEKSSTSMTENASVDDKAGYQALFDKFYSESCRNVSEKLD